MLPNGPTQYSFSSKSFLKSFTIHEDPKVVTIVIQFSMKYNIDTATLHCTQYFKKQLQQSPRAFFHRKFHYKQDGPLVFFLFANSLSFPHQEKSVPLYFKGSDFVSVKSEKNRFSHSVCTCHCFAFFTIVPTAEITVVLDPLALVVTVTTAGNVAVVVRMVG